MRFFRSLVPMVLLCAVSLPVLGTELVACVVADNVQGNATYYGTASTVTRLKCEFTKKDFYPTLGELYRLGWRLIQVVGGDHALSMGNRGPSPLYFLEREQASAPAQGVEQKQNAPATREKKK